MKRLLSWFFICLGASVLFFFGLNLFDSRPGPGPAAQDFPASHLEPCNGFFLVWGFAEPAATDPLAPAYRAQVQELFAALGKNNLFRFRYSQWLTRLNAGFRRDWQGAGLYFPQLPMEDVCAYFTSRRAQVGEQQQRYDVLLKRYRQVLVAADLEDFTPLGWDFPVRSFLLATYTVKLFAASRALAAMDGDWQTAGDDLSAALAAGLKLIGSGRTLAVNSLGKIMVELSLRTLASLLNRTDCPDAVARRILERLPARAIGELGTATVRTFAWMSFAQALERVKRDKVVDPFLLKDFFHDPAYLYTLDRFVAISGPRLFDTVHALAAFFLKKNDSAAALRAFWEGVGRLEETPRYLWQPGTSPAFRLATVLELGPFWWLRNPLGKMMVRSAVPFAWPVLQHYVYRSQGLKVRYDLTRLLVLARLQAGRSMSLNPAMLKKLLVSEDGRDPFSGGPYLFNPGSGMLYSVGPDREDNGGREQPSWWRDSDITVPLKFVISD